MALTEIDLERQSQDGSLPISKLFADFLGGSNWNITNSNNNATISGLGAGTANNDAVNKGQMDAAIAAAVTGAMSYKGTLDASDATGAALDGSAIGDFYLVTVAGVLDGIAFNIGDHLVVNSAITDFDVDGAGKIDIVDNTEANDILRDSDIIDDLTTGGTDKVLSAQQGVVIKGLIDNLQSEVDDTQAGAGLATDGSYVQPSGSNYLDATTSLADADSALDAQVGTNATNIGTNATNIGTNASAITALQNDWAERVFGEYPAVTTGNPVLAALANIPVKTGTARVFINGIYAEPGVGNDYTINETTGVITLEFNPKAKDKVVVDYEY
jgi:hypothetical protein